MINHTRWLLLYQALGDYKLMSAKVKGLLVDSATTPRAAHTLMDTFRDRLPEKLERLLAEDAWCSYAYAHQILRGPFPLGERAIAQNPRASCRYAVFVLRGPFPLGEPGIATDSKIAYDYARGLGSPFPLAEPAIAVSTRAWPYYCDFYGSIRDANYEAFEDWKESVLSRQRDSL